MKTVTLKIHIGLALCLAMSLTACKNGGGGGAQNNQARPGTQVWPVPPWMSNQNTQNPQGPAARNGNGLPPPPLAQNNGPALPPPKSPSYEPVNGTGSRQETAPRGPTRPEDVVLEGPGASNPAPVGPPGQCTPAVDAVSPDWFPGLPAQPLAQPIYTDFQPTKSGLRYTDAHADRLMSIAVDQANADPADLQKASQDFAKSIHSVRVSTDQRQARLEIQIRRKTRKETVELRGTLQTSRKTKRLIAELGAGKKSRYTGLLTCMDADRGCHSVLVRFNTHDNKGRLTASIVIVHRLGNGHLTISEDDRRRFAANPNPNHSALAELFSNTVNNTCLNLLADHKASRRVLSQCQVAQLQAECGGEDYKNPSARSLTFRSWAVAYGHAAFELVLTANGSPNKRGGSFVIAGPLIVDKQVPLNMSGEVLAQKSVLLKNDGGGNLNIGFDFISNPESHMRISVTSLLPDAN